MELAEGRPEDKFSSGVYWINAIVLTIISAWAVGYMMKTTGVNSQPTQNHLTLPMTDNSGQLHTAQ